MTSRVVAGRRRSGSAPGTARVGRTVRLRHRPPDRAHRQRQQELDARDGNEATFSATDTPLTDALVNATSQASGGTQSKITCVNANNADIGNSPQGFADPVR
jgi:hypothetical protein